MIPRLATLALLLLVVLGCGGDNFALPTAPSALEPDTELAPEPTPSDDPAPAPPDGDAAPVPPPPPACTWNDRHFGDFLTLQIDGIAWYDFAGSYYDAAPETRQRIFAEIKARGYTRIYLNLFEQRTGRDYFADPEQLLPYLQEICAAGLGAVLEMGPEDEPGAQSRYRGERYLRQLREFVSVVDAYVAEYLLGVEVEEYWDRHQVLAVGRQLRVLTSRPIWAHFKTPVKGVTPKSWWNSRKGWIGLWATGISFQYPKRDQKNGFLAHPDDIRKWTQYLVPRLAAKGQALLAGEYAYRRQEDTARERGTLAVRSGAVGAMNGIYP